MTQLPIVDALERPAGAAHATCGFGQPPAGPTPSLRRAILGLLGLETPALEYASDSQPGRGQ